MKNILKMTILTSMIYLSQNSYADLIKIDKNGTDQYKKNCSVTAMELANVVSQNKNPLAKINLQLNGVVYSGILAEIISSKIAPFNSTLKKSADKYYTVVVGAPITIGSLGLRKLKGEFKLNSDNMLEAIEVTVDGGFGGAKNFLCTF